MLIDARTHFNSDRLSLLPKVMRSARRWLCWRLKDQSSGKPLKIPIRPNAVGIRLADPTDHSHFGTVGQAVDKCARENLDGIGFALGDGFAGADLDDYIVSGELDESGREFVEPFRGTYCEYSPSSTGLKIFLLSEVPLAPRLNRFSTGGRRQVELYDRSRYFTVTCEPCPWSKPRLIEAGDALLRLQDGLRQRFRQQAEPTATRHPNKPCGLSDEEIIMAASEATNGAKFVALWEGRWDDLCSSQSEADLALCSILAFWTAGDVGRIESLFWQSSLAQRPKWSRLDYREATVSKAVAGSIAFRGGDSFPAGKSVWGAEPRQGVNNCVLNSVNRCSDKFQLVLDRVRELPKPGFVLAVGNSDRRLLAMVCWELQRIVREEPFGFDCRRAGELIGKSRTIAARHLKALVEEDRILELVEAGRYQLKDKRKQNSSTYRFREELLKGETR